MTHLFAYIMFCVTLGLVGVATLALIVQMTINRLHWITQ